jgi:hypothetical protein
MEQAIIIDTPEGIEWFRRRAMLGAMRLEALGMRNSRGSVTARVKREFGITGRRAEVIRKFALMVEG